MTTSTKPLTVHPISAKALDVIQAVGWALNPETINAVMLYADGVAEEEGDDEIEATYIPSALRAYAIDTGKLKEKACRQFLGIFEIWERGLPVAHRQAGANLFGAELERLKRLLEL